MSRKDFDDSTCEYSLLKNIKKDAVVEGLFEMIIVNTPYSKLHIFF